MDEQKSCEDCECEEAKKLAARDLFNGIAWAGLAFVCFTLVFTVSHGDFISAVILTTLLMGVISLPVAMLNNQIRRSEMAMKVSLRHEVAKLKQEQEQPVNKQDPLLYNKEGKLPDPPVEEPGQTFDAAV